MGIIFSNDILSYTPTARSELSPYNIDNITDYWRLARCYSANDNTTNTWLVTLDFGTTKSVSALFLNWVNFSNAIIYGNNTDSWATPSFSMNVEIGVDYRTNRAKAFIELGNFSYRFLQIAIPSGTTAIEGTKWKIGSVVPLASHDELSWNVFSYKKTSTKPFTDVVINGRTTDRIIDSDHSIWGGTLSIGDRNHEYAEEVWALQSISQNSPMVFYENLQNASHAYLCLRNNDYSETTNAPYYISGETIQLGELV